MELLCVAVSMSRCFAVLLRVAFRLSAFYASSHSRLLRCLLPVRVRSKNFAEEKKIRDEFHAKIRA